MKKENQPVNQISRITAAKNKGQQVEIKPKGAQIDTVETGDRSDKNRVVTNGDLPDHKHVAGLVDGEGKIKIRNVKKSENERGYE